MEKSGSKTIGTKANLIVGVAAGAVTVIITQVVMFHYLLFCYTCIYISMEFGLYASFMICGVKLVLAGNLRYVLIDTLIEL